MLRVAMYFSRLSGKSFNWTREHKVGSQRVFILVCDSGKGINGNLTHEGLEIKTLLRLIKTRRD